jgi:hypothetical protein
MLKTNHLLKAKVKTVLFLKKKKEKEKKNNKLSKNWGKLLIKLYGV